MPVLRGDNWYIIWDQARVSKGVEEVVVTARRGRSSRRSGGGDGSGGRG